MMEKEIQKVVILGGGFGGVYSFLEAARRFRNNPYVKVVLISKSDRFLFVPMLHEVATGNLLPSSITQPLRSLIKKTNTEFIRAEISEIDLDKGQVLIQPERSKSHEVIKYDYLVSALGSSTNFFGTVGAQENCLTLKDLPDARKLKNQMIDSFEKAQWVDQPQQEKHLRFIVVGGGPTGVELAGEMADFLRHELNDSFPKLCPMAKVTLIQSSDKLLSQADEWFHKKSEKILKEMGVEIIYNKRVTKVDEKGVYLDSEFIESETVIWTAGVKANSLAVQNVKKVELDERMGRIRVNKYLQIPEYSNVFVVGDQACVFDKESGQPYPMRAQFAAREGSVAGRNIFLLESGRELVEFEWKDQGFIVSLGKGGALAEIYGVRISGFVAWWMYRTAYLFKLVGFRAKIRTVIEWTLNLFLPRDVSKL